MTDGTGWRDGEMGSCDGAEAEAIGKMERGMRHVPRMPVDGIGFERVVFLDVDGVLNDDCHVLGKPAIDDERVSYLAHIVCATNARIVLSSSWKLAWARFADAGYEPSGDCDGDLVLLKELLDRYDLVIDGLTYDSPESGPVARPYEIRSWLANHPSVRSFVILDDDDFWEFGWMDRFFVCTRTETGKVAWPGWPEVARGLTLEHAKRAIGILLDEGPLSRSSERRSHDDMYLARIREQRKADGRFPS